LRLAARIVQRGATLLSISGSANRLQVEFTALRHRILLLAPIVSRTRVATTAASALGSSDEENRMSTQSYTIRTDVKSPPLQLIDVSALAAETKDPWFNQTTTASSTRRAIVGQDNLFATLTYDRDGWERVQRGIDVSEVATASAFPAARPSTRGEPGRATARSSPLRRERS